MADDLQILALPLELEEGSPRRRAPTAQVEIDGGKDPVAP
jgi:hypothetical protein